MMVENVVIIGSGPAGLSAALYTAREGFNPIVIAGTDEGGQLLLTTTVENYPAFPDGITGPQLIDNMRMQAERQGARFAHEYVKDVDLTSKPIKVVTDKATYLSKSLIIASGASSKWIGLESESKFIGRGVSSCATCDGPLFKNKDVIVVGGGDTAMEDSLFLTGFAKSVTLIHRRNEFKASRIMQDRLRSNPKIRIILDTTIDEILGDARVTSVRIKGVKTGKTEEIKTDGVFIAIGHKPNTEFLNGKLKLDDGGYIITRNIVETDIDGVYVGGDVADKEYRQAVTAAGTGTMCALKVRHYLQSH
jgi:thioredoxin reductase (NADPH)